MVFRWGRAVGGGNIIRRGAKGDEEEKWLVSCEFVALWSLLGGWMSNVTEAVTEVVFECIRGR